MEDDHGGFKVEIASIGVWNHRRNNVNLDMHTHTSEILFLFEANSNEVVNIRKNML